MSARIGSLCSGYEGVGVAVTEVLGGELAFVADNDPGACKILAHRFPDAANLGDITETDWAEVEPVDILTAGFPCQDVSAAGKRAGLRKGTRSGVWIEVSYAIAALRPSLVIIENVRGLLTARGDEPSDEHLRAEAARDTILHLLDWLDNETRIAKAKGDIRRVRECATRTARVMGLRKQAVARCQWHERRLVRAIGTVLGSLADLGYDTQWTLLSASDAGAPHRRERVFIVAWPAADTSGGEFQRRGIPGILAGPQRAAASPGDQRERDGHAPGHSGEAAAADTATADAQWRGRTRFAGKGAQQGQPRRPQPEPGDSGDPAEDPDGAAGRERRVAAPGQAESGGARSDARGPGGAPPADAHGQDARPHRRRSDTASPAGQADGPGWGSEPGSGISGSTPAHTERDGREGQQRVDRPDEERRPASPGGGCGPAGSSSTPADTPGDLRGRGPGELPATVRDTTPGRDTLLLGDAPECGSRDASDANGGGLGARRTPAVLQQGGNRADGGESRADDGRCGPAGTPAHTYRAGSETRGDSTLREPRRGRQQSVGGCDTDWGAYGSAIARWEQILGRPAPRPTEPGRTGERLSPAFVEFMMGLPEGWVTGVPGLSRSQQLHALGNGVVPRQCAMALRMLLPAWLEAAA